MCKLYEDLLLDVDAPVLTLLSMSGRVQRSPGGRLRIRAG